jgi:DNA invertase Pin-like site-specific DNA recombinase
MKYGYARVSTDDQSTALQLAALKRAGCKTLFKDEGLSGATIKRPALLRCLKALQDGDTLIVWKLDRLGRNLRDLIPYAPVSYDTAVLAALSQNRSEMPVAASIRLRHT